MQKILIINENDNVAVAVQPLKKGDEIGINVKGQKELNRLRICQNIPFSHKIALRRIKRGEKIIKYGEPVGEATKDISEGEYVHIHNIESRKGRGDLQIS